MEQKKSGWWWILVVLILIAGLYDVCGADTTTADTTKDAKAGELPECKARWEKAK